MKIDEIRHSILYSLARKQKIANIVLFFTLVYILVWIQTNIDNSERGLFLQGWGCLIYVLTGIYLVLLWIVISKMSVANSIENVVKIVDQGTFVSTQDELAIKLINAYLAVTKKINLDPKKYTLLCLASEKDNAFATGLSRNSTVCVYSKTAEEATKEELEAILAHEFGHLTNRDLILMIIQKSLSGCVSSFAGISGFFLMWYCFGIKTAAILLLVTGVLIPLVANYSSRVTEQFADIFAVNYGYGLGLISFLTKHNKPDFNFWEILLNHPNYKSRTTYIQNYILGNDGKVRDSVEHWIWLIVKIVLILACAVYLSINEVSVINFLAAGGLYLLSDQLLYNNFGIKHIGTTKKYADLNTKGKIMAVTTSIAVVFLYGAGIFACVRFYNSESTLLSTLSHFTLYMWIAKPFAEVMGDNGNDIMAAVSEISVYLALITSIAMMASFFFVI